MTDYIKGSGSGRALFKELRLRYLKRLEAACETFNLASERAQSGEKPGDLFVLRDLVHRLAGSGTTYGFPDVSEAAFAAEDSLDAAISGHRDARDLAMTLTQLRDAVDSAVQLYRQESQLDKLRKERSSASAPKAAAPLGQEEARIVLVDDDPSVSDLLWAAFSRFGYETEVLRDGIAAMASIKHRRPDLIILDRGLPVMSGTSVLLELQQDTELSKIPVIVLSAKAPSAWFSEQNVRYIQKPFMPDVVVGEATALLKARQDQMSAEVAL
ncbi:response regulator [Parvularcula sp. ZS-1/3]|uniref:Response regulator n=1 Tax=Parvularcula mediterranea TaxID=2732508 RepID=A0A7Y3W4W0_9PROT|nr:response regulator [Parvularcula mediterranea]NNU15969.1 response regulator [Parvularcula mediterranea]